MENESNKKETAVEWLLEQYSFGNYGYEIGEQAKQLERHQHGDTWDAAIQAHEDRGHVLARSNCDFDDYFNETYGGNK